MYEEHIEVIKKHHPRIAATIELFWGCKETPEYFEMLILDTRDGTRQGFHPDIISALFKLDNIHMKQFPYLYKETLWDVKK